MISHIHHQKISSVVTIGLLILLTGILYQCEQEEFITNGEAGVHFSTDTVHFDTIFSDIGSTTQLFKIYNPHDQKIKLSSIYLAKGKQSNYRLNIDGIQSNQVDDLVLPAHDSIFIFVEVTIDPGQDQMLEKDSIIVSTNNQTQNVKLVSYGQDVHLIHHYELRTDSTFPTDKPFLVTNHLIVDTNQVLKLDSGTKIYCGKEAQITIEGTLQTRGTYDHPVIFTGSRLDESYEDIPSQWGGIYITNSSQNTSLQYTNIRNGVIGLKVGSRRPANHDTAHPAIKLENCIIKNMSYAGIQANNANIQAGNLVVANCGHYATELLAGGRYRFYHTTIANFYNYANRNEPSVYFTNGSPFTEDLSGPLSLHFYNSIIYGYNQNEIEPNQQENNVAFAYLFDHCLVKASQPLDTAHFVEPLINVDPDFVSIEDDDFMLESSSEAIDQGNMAHTSLYYTDFTGTGRNADAGPDLGAYEFTD